MLLKKQGPRERLNTPLPGNLFGDGREMRAGDLGAPTIVKLRKELLEAQQPLTETTNEKVKRQADELRGARLATQDLTRQDASACLNVRRAHTPLSEAQRVIDAQEEQIRRQRLELAERRPALARGESSSSSAITGGADPAVKIARPFVGPVATAAVAGLHHQDHRPWPSIGIPFRSICVRVL